MLEKIKRHAQHIFRTLEQPTWRFGVQPPVVDVPVGSQQPFFKEFQQGIVVCDLHTFAKKYPEKIKLLSGSTKWQQHKYAALVEGFWNNSLVLFVAKNIQQQVPIELHTLLTQIESDYLIEKVVVIVEDGAHVVVHDMIAYMHEMVFRTVDVFVQSHAQCTFVYEQNVSLHTSFFAYLNVYADAYACVDVQALMTGGGKSKWWPTFIAHGEHAVIKIGGAYSARKNQQCDIVSLQQHDAAHSVSHLAFNGVIADNAHAVYEGMVHIALSAPGVDASQQNKNMVLHKTAKVQSIPSLEALNNEVQCAHGSAIGHFDNEQLFYLMARGLPKQVAQQLVLNSFLQRALQDCNVLRKKIPLLTQNFF